MTVIRFAFGVRDVAMPAVSVTALSPIGRISHHPNSVARLEFCLISSSLFSRHFSSRSCWEVQDEPCY